MPETDGSLRRLSKQVFNSEHRLTLARQLLAQPDMVTCNELADLAGVPRSTTHDELNLMSRIAVAQRVQPDRTVFYHRIDGPFWRWCEDLIASVGTAATSLQDRVRLPGKH